MKNRLTAYGLVAGGFVAMFLSGCAGARAERRADRPGERQQAARERLNDWPEVSRLAAEQMIDRYGEPQESTASLMIWRNNGQWKRTVVHRDGVTHRFPEPHVDVIEQTIDYRVPVDRIADLARFNGSLSVHRTAGELTSRSQTEEANWQAINLADEIVRGRRSVEDARAFFTRRARLAPAGRSYMDGPLFEVEPDSADPDESAREESR